MHLALISSTLRFSRQPVLAVRGLRQQLPSLSCNEAALRPSSPFCSSSGIQAASQDVTQDPAPPQKQASLSLMLCRCPYSSCLSAERVS